MTRFSRILLTLGAAALGGMIIREGFAELAKVQPLDLREGTESPRGWALVSRTPTVGSSPDPHMVSRLDEPIWARDLGAWIPAKPRGWRQYLAYVWASPITLVGSLIGASQKGTLVVTDGVAQWRGLSGWFANRLKAQGSTAITFGHSQLYLDATPSAQLQRHEMVHTRQAERFGLTFGPLYWWCQLAFGYGRNPLEKAARRGAREDSGSDTLLGAGSTQIV